MKIRKYGYSQFKVPTELKFAVMVPTIIFDENDSRCIKDQEWRFVTSISPFDKTYLCEKHKKAYLFKDRKSAQDFCIGLAWNFTAGYVVEVLEGMDPSNN